MTTTVRALLAFATLSISSSPVAAGADTIGAACRVQHNDPIVLRRTIPSGVPHATSRRAIANVTVSREGLVRRVVLALSSGDPRFDSAALRATKETAFAPAARSCSAIEASFNYAVSASTSGFQTAVMPGSIAIVASRR